MVRWIGMFVLVVLLFNGCSVIPPDRQFVSSIRAGDGVKRDDSLCDEESFPVNHQRMTALSNRGGLNPASIAVVNWNIYKGKRKGWQEDLLKYSRGNDLLLLQEVAVTPEVKDILEESAFFWNFNSAFKVFDTEMGVLLASRVEPSLSCGLRTDEPLLGIPKTVVVSRFPIRGRGEELLVVNVHGINITLGVGAYKEQFNRLEKVIEQHHGPVLLAGDMNNWRKGREEVLNRLITNLSLTPLSFDPDSRTFVFDKPVDQVYYRGLEPIRVDVYEVTTSDHNPIVAAFRVNL